MALWWALMGKFMRTRPVPDFPWYFALCLIWELSCSKTCGTHAASTSVNCDGAAAPPCFTHLCRPQATPEQNPDWDVSSRVSGHRPQLSSNVSRFMERMDKLLCSVLHRTAADTMCSLHAACCMLDISDRGRSGLAIWQPDPDSPARLAGELDQGINSSVSADGSNTWSSRGG